MPKRSKWATRELAEFLKYCYSDNLDPQEIGGSYAGAFGFGQFIPSSFTDIQLTLMVMGFVSHMTGPMFWVACKLFEDEWVQSKQQELYKERRYI